tara:strand:+ start:154 stop:426 length:273 start_codon:yes stop_codon:yes gene_type:complete
MYEKKISPKNKEIDNRHDIKIENSSLKINNVVKINDIKVPFQVLLGLTWGTIKGPFRDLPKIYAIVSLKKAIKIVKYIRSRSKLEIEKKL